MLGPRYPFLIYLFTVVLTAWVCGSGAAVLALVLSFLATVYFIIPPFATFAISGPVVFAGLFLYLPVGAIAIAVIEGERRHRRRLEQKNADRQQAEDELRKSEARLRLAMEAGNLGTWEWDIASGRVSCSDTLEGILGLPAGGFDGTLEGYQRLIHPDDRKGVLQTIRSAVETGERTTSSTATCGPTARPAGSPDGAGHSPMTWAVRSA